MAYPFNQTARTGTSSVGPFGIDWDKIRRMREGQGAAPGQPPAPTPGAPPPVPPPLPVVNTAAAGGDRMPPAPMVNPAAAGEVNPAVPPFYTQPWVPPSSNPPVDFPEHPEYGPLDPANDWLWPQDPERDWSGIYGQYDARTPTLPAWAESMGFQAGQDIQGMMGTSPTTPQEQFALQEIAQLMDRPEGPGAEESAAAGSMMGALGDQPPGGRAFESIMAAIEPAWKRQQDELYDVYRADMAKKGLTYSGRYGEGLEGLMGRAGESFAAATAPYAMRGEELSQEERMGAQSGLMGYGQEQWQRPLTQAGFTVPSMMNYGAGQYNRMWDPYENLFRLMGGMQGQVVPEPASPGFWDYAVGIGSAALGNENTFK